MMGPQYSLGKLIVTLMVCSVALVALCFTKQAEAANKVVTTGEIEVYGEDGLSPMASYDFSLFKAGISGTHFNCFFVKNTGRLPVWVKWSITTSSIVWKPNVKHGFRGYYHYEGGVCKYSFGIRQEFRVVGGYLAPESNSFLLEGGKRAKLWFELSYTGKPSTAETFTLTVSFCAISAPRRSLATERFDPDDLNLRNNGVRFLPW